MNFIKKILKHPLSYEAGFLTASQYIAAGIGFLTTIFATRILGPEKYGIAVLIMAYPTLLWSFASFKPITITTRYISGFRATKQHGELLSICKLGYILDFLSSCLVLVIVIFSARWVAGHFYKLPELTWLIVLYGISFLFFSLAGTSRAILTSWKAFRLYAIFQIIERVLQFVFVVGLLLLNYGYTGMIIGTALSHTIFGIIMLIFATEILRRGGVGLWYKSSIKQVKHLFKEITSLFRWNYGLITLTGIVEQLPVILLGRFRNPEEAGFYRLALNITTMSSYIEASLKRIIYPRLSEAFELREILLIKKNFKRWSIQYGLPVGFILIIGIILMPIIVLLIFGEKYNPVIPLVQIMLCGYVISGIFFWVESFYYASKQIKLWTQIYSAFAILIILFSWFFITIWGSLGMVVLVTVGKAMCILIAVKIVYGQTKRA